MLMIFGLGLRIGLGENIRESNMAPPYRPEGDPKTCRLAVIGEAPAAEEMRYGRPLVGNTGELFGELSSGAGIPRAWFYLTNVFDFRVKKPKERSGTIQTFDGDRLWTDRSGFTEIGWKSVERLKSELVDSSANVLVPMGGPALEALTGQKGIVKHRGSILESVSIGGKIFKVIPTIHPAATFKGKFLWRYDIRHDFKRIRRELEFPEILRPPYNFNLNPTYRQCLETLEWIKRDKKEISVDIEMANKQVSRICFVWSDYDGITVPFGVEPNWWTLEEECQILLAIANVLEDTNITKIFQNAVFDISMLQLLLGIFVKGRIEDTMIAHSLMYPDFGMGLAYLTSLYTDQPFYKDMVKMGDVEKVHG